MLVRQTQNGFQKHSFVDIGALAIDHLNARYDSSLILSDYWSPYPIITSHIVYRCGGEGEVYH